MSYFTHNHVSKGNKNVPATKNLAKKFDGIKHV